MGVGIVIIIITLFVGLMAYGIISTRKRRAAMQTLAAKNGWVALSADETTLAQYLPQYITMLGQQNYGFGSYTRTNTSYDMAYKAAVGNSTAVLFQYEYTEYQQSADPDQGEQSQTSYFTILNLSLPGPEPTVLLLHHSFASKLTNFGLHNGLQKIDLEGNFSQYYDTYITPGAQVEALSVFTPDVMELVMAMAGSKGHASMQMSGPSLAISFDNQLLTPEFIEPLLAQAAALLAKLEAKPHTYPTATS